MNETAKSTEIKEILKAAVIAHWPTGPVLCCIPHAENLKNIGDAMGVHVHVEPYNGDELCINCVNEAKNKR